VFPVFYAFRAMVGIGLTMLFVAWTGLAQLLRGKLAETSWLLRVLPWMVPSGFCALLAGWFTTEIGRQPYVVYGLMRSADAVSPLPGASVATTLMLFLLVYGGVFGAGIYYIVRLVRAGPPAIVTEPPKLAAGAERAATPARPLGAPADSIEDGI
jgi:cytochrome d ubiquinol oxidase subunit I